MVPVTLFRLAMKTKQVLFLGWYSYNLARYLGTQNVEDGQEVVEARIFCNLN